MNASGRQALEDDSPSLLSAVANLHNEGPKVVKFSVEKKGSWYSRRRAKGKSAMIGTVGLALHF